MDERYIQSEIEGIWCLLHKLQLWQKTELAALEAKATAGYISMEDFRVIEEALESNPINVSRFKELDAELHHDLNAFITERAEHIPPHLKHLLHEDMTSYDTQEPAFARMQIASIEIVLVCANELERILIEMARKYRHTIMLSRTHGQWAELQTFGKRVLTWLQDLRLSKKRLGQALGLLGFSKMSGAVGNFTGLDPELEKEALGYLRFEPYYGATQIMPREAFFPIASVLYQMVATINKIALAIRLGARSGHPICKEPFGKKQKGSSAMPHKENTILTEQIEGLLRMARGYVGMAGDNIETWEERAIEQSCVERVAWPDLYHVTIRAIRVLTRVLAGLRVYPDNMMKEVVESCGCYAASEVKEFLKKKIVERGLDADEGYRIVQLAAFNCFAPLSGWMAMRNELPVNLEAANGLLNRAENMRTDTRNGSIQARISRGMLETSPELAASDDQVTKWNAILSEIFSDEVARQEWNKIFQPSYLLRNEHVLYEKILGE